MKKVEITEEMKNDFRIVQLRNFADPKRFYRRNDLKTIPEVFQVGTMVSVYWSS